MKTFFDVYAIFNRRMNCILGWSEYKNECDVFIKQRKLNNINEIIYTSLTASNFNKLKETFGSRELSEYYGLIIFSDEEYVIDKYFDEEMCDLTDRASLLSRYNRDKRVESQLIKILDDCKRSISYGEKFNNIFNHIYDARKISSEIKRLDTEYKNIISNQL